MSVHLHFVRPFPVQGQGTRPGCAAQSIVYRSCARLSHSSYHPAPSHSQRRLRKPNGPPVNKPWDASVRDCGLSLSLNVQQALSSRGHAALIIPHSHFLLDACTFTLFSSSHHTRSTPTITLSSLVTRFFLSGRRRPQLAACCVSPGSTEQPR